MGCRARNLSVHECMRFFRLSSPKAFIYPSFKRFRQKIYKSTWKTGADSNEDEPRDASFLFIRYDLIGSGQDRWRDRKADRFRCCEIDHKFEFGRLHEGKLRRAGTMHYLMHVIRTIPI